MGHRGAALDSLLLLGGTTMRFATTTAIVLLSGLLLAAPPKVVEDIRAKVIGVTDGDTITVLVNNETIKVRLEGIDAPESGQSFGTKSKQALSELVFGKAVTVRKTGTDKYGRTLGMVIVGDMDANAKMIEDGWAWHFKKYNDEKHLAELETQARIAKKGLWSDPNSLAPWDYRARKKTPEPVAADESDPGAMFWLNTSSGVRHNNSCEHFRNTKRGRLCASDEGKACRICGG